jgi:S1-C subfamily serine protease
MSRALAVAGLLVGFASSTQAAQSGPKETITKAMTLPEAVESVRPSVVQIVAQVVRAPSSNSPAQVPTRPVTIPLGTGFMVNADGYVITARHVVEALQSIQIPGSKSLWA